MEWILIGRNGNRNWASEINVIELDLIDQVKLPVNWILYLFLIDNIPIKKTHGQLL